MDAPTEPLHPLPAPVAPGGHDTGDESAIWPTQIRSARIRMRPLTAVLAVLLVATLGVWGGAELQKREGTSSSGSAAASALLSRFRAAGGGTGGFGRSGAGGGAGAAAGVTFGTVTVISGNTLYLTSSTGAIVKVKLTKATTYTRNSKITKAGLKPGDTAIVQGTANAKGVTTARSVASTAKGVTTGFGGFRGGFGGGGGGAGATGGSGQ
jgi:hypothetical protein